MPCSIDSFLDITIILNTNKRKYIEKIGLGGLIHMKRVPMQEPKLQCLQGIYDPTQDKFIFASGEIFSVYPFDIHVVMGLDGTIVQLDENVSAQDIPCV